MHVLPRLIRETVGKYTVPEGKILEKRLLCGSGARIMNVVLS